MNLKHYYYYYKSVLSPRLCQEIIDYGELSSAQYKSLYGFDGKHAESPSFLTGIKEWKKKLALKKPHINFWQVVRWEF